jgi:hypothetical protein
MLFWIRLSLQEKECLFSMLKQVSEKRFFYGKGHAGTWSYSWRSSVDIPFPKKVRDEIVSAGLAEPHHILPETGWVSFYLREERDVQNAISLLRRSYEIASRQQQPR